MSFDLVPLSEQFDNHDEYSESPSASLAGETFSLDVDELGKLRVSFVDETQLGWNLVRPESQLGGTDEYENIDLRPGLHLIAVSRIADRMSALCVLDTIGKRAIGNLTTFEGKKQQIRENTRFFHGTFSDAPAAQRFQRTDELVGKRLHHRYSSTHAYEHIYLNSNVYVFHCLEGPEAGQADVDRTDTFKLADQLYLLSWHERSQPFNGAVVIDLAAGRANGRLFGWDQENNRASQIRSGSIVSVLNETGYNGL
jgi:hypothetical protein